MTTDKSYGPEKKTKTKMVTSNVSIKTTMVNELES